MRLIPSSLLAALLALSACAVGPDYTSPAAPDAATYGSGALPDKTAAADGEGGAAQSFAPGHDIPAEWWTLYRSKPLDELITRAVKGNPDLAAADATLRAAEETTKAEFGILFPTVKGSFSSTRQKTARPSSGGFAPGSIYTLHNASVSVSYGLDLFGASRRAVEKAEAQEDASRYKFEAAYLSLTANVVTAAVQEASLKGQLDAARTVAADAATQLDLLKQQFAAGSVAKSAVLEGETTLEQARSALPPLEKQLAQTRHLLAALEGKLPSEAPKTAFTLASLNLPKKLPVSLPSSLVAHRPDIRMAEANLHAASAAIGIAVAARLPQITLSANMGSVANHLDQLFTPNGGIWSLGANVAETVFDAGSLWHQENAARADYDAAAADYRKTVIAAFQNVADVLHALQDDAHALQARAAAARAAADNLDLAKQRFDAGAISRIDLLTAQQSYQQAVIARVAAEAQRYADTAALFQALGGGWWNRAGDIMPAGNEITAANTPDKAEGAK